MVKTGHPDPAALVFLFETQERTAVNLYKNLEELGPYGLSKPFMGLFSVKWRADQILKKRGIDEWKNAAPVLQCWISELKESRLKEDVDHYIHERSAWLSIEGGWELAYLERDPFDLDQVDKAVTEDEIRNLLRNWPPCAEEKPDFPTKADLNDLDALQDILCSGYPYDDIEGLLLAH